MRNRSNSFYSHHYEPVRLETTGIRLAPPYRVPLEEIEALHLHDTVEFGLCLAGQGIFIVEDKVMPFKAGDVSIINEFEFHRARSTGGQPSVWRFLNFNPQQLKTGDPDQDYCCDSARLGGSKFRNLLDGEQFPRLRDAMRLLIAEQEAPHSQPAATANLLRYMLLQLTALARPAEPALLVRRDVEQLAPALKKITGSYMEKLTVARLARLCHMSTSSFYRLFTAVFGRSPQRYLTQYRVQMGAYLLRHKNCGVEAAAVAVGYETQSAFHRPFKAAYGLSPVAYRQGKKPPETPAGKS